MRFVRVAADIAWRVTVLTAIFVGVPWTCAQLLDAACPW